MAASVEVDLQPFHLEQLPIDPLLLVLSLLDYRDLMSLALNRWFAVCNMLKLSCPNAATEWVEILLLKDM
ncbi:UNVERIFIED_CONTAM: hypothetical protein K2H54_056120 [Gekko kuhli]